MAKQGSIAFRNIERRTLTVRLFKSTLLVVAALLCHSAVAGPKATMTPSPLGHLQRQLDALAARIETLENNDNAPSSSVDGRTYCMMVNATALSGLASDGSETLATEVVRRITSFSGGIFTSVVVSASRNLQEDNGVVSILAGLAPPLLAGTYVQTGRKVDVMFPDGPTNTWYVSGDGTVLHNNAIGFFGPFPNSLTLGLVRSATMIESDTCDPTGVD
jgi:hypothetical protein